MVQIWSHFVAITALFLILCNVFFRCPLNQTLSAFYKITYFFCFSFVFMLELIDMNLKI